MTVLRLTCLILATLLWPAPVLAQVQVDNGAASPAVSAADDGNAAALAARLRALAAEKDEPQPEADATGPAEAASGTGESGGPTASMPAGPASGIPFTRETEAAYQKAWQAYYTYRADGYIHRQRVFAWQDVSTKITFAVVILLVLAGVYFAAVQFHVGMREGRQTGEPGEVEMSFKGIKVRSPVLGVIVLTISLAFFYLYLIYVYPIQNVF